MTDPVSRAALRWPWLVPLQGHSSILIQVQVLRDGRPGKQRCQRVVRDHDARTGCPHMLELIQQGWRDPVFKSMMSVLIFFRFCVQSQICETKMQILCFLNVCMCISGRHLRPSFIVFSCKLDLALLRWNSPTDLFRLSQLWLPNTHKQCLFL